ncbi:hypothetical protein [Mesorhizobium sp. KR1-2]|uniref:hypothetical protein n=1 Tax=Mesorhizobium sp. KR1-2 TaxID=3156609 RepID=UPI0032B3F43C
MLADLQTLVDDMVRDDAARIDADQRDRAIALALVQYGRDRPRRFVSDVTMPEDGLIELPEGARAILTVEYPVGLRPPRFLSPHQWSRYDAPEGPRELVSGVATGATMRVTFGGAHALTEDQDTVPPEDREALTSYAAAILFDQVAAMTSGDGNPTIPADAVNHGAKPENFAKRAERWRQRYHDLLGIDVKRTKAASVVVQTPLASTTGGSRLTHGRGRFRR